MQELRAIVRGRVQMVMYRDFVKRGARFLGLVGWVKNLSDGSVAVVAQGEHSSLERLVTHLHKGSLLSRVDSVVVEWGTPQETYERFNITY